ncbi:catalysis At the Interface: the anatomy of A conformational change in A triglyceride lipase [Fennellomyces sp. T-0311]|nr:catalysis At the Interface: the anatomy of A conformational change in A triglyceride lipase [Fennellomyces sp. T-0311]
MKFTLPLTLLVNLLLPLLAVAVPVRLVEKRQNGVREATQDEIDELTFYASLSADVYCTQVVPGGQLTCPNCDKASGLKVVETFSTTFYDTNVLVARGDSKKTIYVVFRGSVSITNWMADLSGTFTPYRPVSGGYVHVGFLASYNDVQDELMATIKSELQAHPDYTVAVSGHSLGGATGLLCALDLYQEGIENVILYTQGQPRVGNKAFAQYVINTGIPYKRAVHNRDSVPQVPSNAMGFYHAGEEFWDTGSTVKVCPNGLESRSCSKSVEYATVMTDHLTYFGMSTGVCL